MRWLKVFWNQPWVVQSLTPVVEVACFPDCWLKVDYIPLSLLWTSQRICCGSATSSLKKMESQKSIMIPWYYWFMFNCLVLWYCCLCWLTASKPLLQEHGISKGRYCSSSVCLKFHWCRARWCSFALLAFSICSCMLTKYLNGLQIFFCRTKNLRIWSNCEL